MSINGHDRQHSLTDRSRGRRSGDPGGRSPPEAEALSTNERGIYLTALIRNMSFVTAMNPMYGPTLILCKNPDPHWPRLGGHVPNNAHHGYATTKWYDKHRHKQQHRQVANSKNWQTMSCERYEKKQKGKIKKDCKAFQRKTFRRRILNVSTTKCLFVSFICATLQPSRFLYSPTWVETWNGRRSYWYYWRVGERRIVQQYSKKEEE